MRWMAVLAVAMLSACVPGLGGSERAALAPKASPLAAEVIETTALETPTAQTTALNAAQTAASPAATAPDEAGPAAPEPTEEVAAVPTAQAPAPLSPEEARCLKSGGSWATAGDSGAKACVRLTRDGGKSCTRQSQCEGFCLARSRTCAPITPMFGCTEILQDDGREVTLCLD
ncbi:MAG: hypothetical protein FJX28_14575 [Alphaproteobacteria bacterium]|nr:hypothetical protein [Alphaproteobacteria bacterium]